MRVFAHDTVPVTLVLAALLSACGGGSNEEVAAGPGVLDNRLVASRAEAWIEHTPSLVTVGGMQVRCRLLTVRFVLNAGDGLPSGLVPTGIQLRQEDGRVLLNADVASSDAFRSADNREMTIVTQGCEPGGMALTGSTKPSLPVVAAIDIQLSGSAARLTAPTTSLYFPF